MRYVLLISLFVCSLAHAADVYQQQSKTGGVVYSDVPQSPNATVVQTAPANTAPTTAAPEAPSSASEETPATPSGAATTSAQQGAAQTTEVHKPYTTLYIASPANEETIQNQPVIYVSVKVEPSLQKGDKIQIFLDGNPWGKSLASTRFQFTAPDRGTHSISAELIDEQNKILKTSGANTIYVHQAHIGGAN